MSANVTAIGPEDGLPPSKASTWKRPSGLLPDPEGVLLIDPAQPQEQKVAASPFASWDSLPRFPRIPWKRDAVSGAGRFTMVLETSDRHAQEPMATQGRSGRRPEPQLRFWRKYAQDGQQHRPGVCGRILEADPDHFDALHLLRCGRLNRGIASNLDGQSRYRLRQWPQTPFNPELGPLDLGRFEEPWTAAEKSSKIRFEERRGDITSTLA